MSQVKNKINEAMFSVKFDLGEKHGLANTIVNAQSASQAKTLVGKMLKKGLKAVKDVSRVQPAFGKQIDKKTESVKSIIKTLVQQEIKELEESNTTASAGIDGTGTGHYDTPMAFSKKKKKGHKKPDVFGFEKVNEVVKKEVDAVNKVLQNLKKLRKDYMKIMNMGDKTLKGRQFNKYYETILNSEQEINKLHSTLKGHLVFGINEGRYHDWRNDETLSPKQKIGRSMREVRDSLNGLSKLIDMNVKLKNELSVDSNSYWKYTHKAMSKISERLVKLANKVGKLQ